MLQRILRYKRKFRHTEDKIISCKGNKTKEKLLRPAKQEAPGPHHSLKQPLHNKQEWQYY